VADRPERVERALQHLVNRLRLRLKYLREFSDRAFSSEPPLTGHVAAELRVLVVADGGRHHRPLLLDLMDACHYEVTVGDADVSLRDWMAEPATRTVIGERVIERTRAGVVRVLAEQVGGAHEDWSIDVDLHVARYDASVEAIAAWLAVLKVIADVVLEVGDGFVEAVRSGRVRVPIVLESFLDMSDEEWQHYLDDEYDDDGDDY
jgi:hypothetical protein